MVELKSQVKEVLDNFENTNHDTIIEVLKQIKPHLRSNLTQDYLDGKISKIAQTGNDKERADLVASLKPYLDWYLQGN